MPKPPDLAGLALFLTELQSFLEACDQDVDQALADHFGFEEAVDWAIVSLELFAEDLLQATEPTPTSQLPGVTR